MALAFLALAIAVGAAFPIQAGLNARLATWLGGPIRASLISFSVDLPARITLIARESAPGSRSGSQLA